MRTGGSGAPLLLVHGGMRGAAGWGPLWSPLTARFEVSAMDRRGRGSSGDSPAYSIDMEIGDVSAVISELAGRRDRPVDVFGHSFGAVTALGAAARGARVRRLALYEPPGPVTVPAEWVRRVRAWIAAGEVGRAVGSFLHEVIGYASEEVERMRDSPLAAHAIEIASHTMVREAEALAGLDLPSLARSVSHPVLLLHGEHSPHWAKVITDELAATLPAAEVTVLPGQGHDAVDAAPDLVARRLVAFFSAGAGPGA